MNSHAQTHGSLKPGETFAEIGIVEHEGKAFASGGAYITDDHLIAYLRDDLSVTTWEGQVIGRYRTTKSWATPQSFLSSRMHQVYVTLDDGRCYTGRSGGAGLVVRARRLAQQRRTA